MKKLKQYLLDLINKDIQGTQAKIEKFENILASIPEEINPRAADMKVKLARTQKKLESAYRHKERLQMIIAKQIL